MNVSQFRCLSDTISELLDPSLIMKVITLLCGLKHSLSYCYTQCGFGPVKAVHFILLQLRCSGVILNIL